MSSASFVEQNEHSGTLQIRGLQEVDAGQYTCVASNFAGTSSGTVTLEVGSKCKQNVFMVEQVSNSSSIKSNNDERIKLNTKFSV